MSIELLLYSIEILSNIDKVLGMAFAFYFVFALIVFGFLFIDRIACYNDDDVKEWYKTLINLKKYTKWYFIPFLTIIIVSIFIPSEKTMYMMMGSHYLKKSDLPSKVEMVLNKKLDEYLIETTKKIKKMD